MSVYRRRRVERRPRHSHVTNSLTTRRSPWASSTITIRSRPGSGSIRCARSSQHQGVERARFLLTQLRDEASRVGARPAFTATTPYRNTIPPEQEAKSPGNRELEHKIRAAIRWNAVAIILRANKESSELGGHIASFQSSALLYDIGFGHFWHAPTADHGGDLIYVQGHVSPGIYARAFVEGRLTEQQLLEFPPGERRQGHSVVSAPVAHAGLLAVPDGVDGTRPADGDLPGALPQVPRRTRPRQDRRPQGVGVPGRRRVRRARVARRDFARRPRAPRQPDLRHQLQPAAPRRAGARQRQDHPGAGGRVPRRRLERDQGRLGLGLGQALREGQGRHPARSAWRSASTASTRTSRARTARTCASTSSTRRS